MIIDSHAHVAPSKDGLGAKQDASVDSFLRALDPSPVDKVVLLPIEPVIPNDFVQQVAAQRPERVACYGSVNPNDGVAAIEAFDRMAGESNIVGLKLHPRRQNFNGAALPVLKELTRLAASRDLPVLMDSFPYGKTALQDDSLEMIAALSEAVPEAKLIIAHMGGIRILEALIVARTSYRIYMDLSLTYSVYRGSHIEQDIFYAIRRIGADRCLYGSDYPDVGLTQYYEAMRKALDAHGFSSNEQDRIFGGTAQDVLGIT